MATVRIPLTETQRFIAGHIYDNLSRAGELRAELKSLDTYGKKLKAELTKQLKNKAEYKELKSDDDVELDGLDTDLTTTKIIYLSRDVRKSEIDGLALIQKLTKIQMLEVMGWSLKKLLRMFPKLHEQFVTMRSTGTRKYSVVKDQIEETVEDNANDDAE